MFFAFYNFSRSLQTGSISTNAPIFRLNFTLTAALAIVFLGEPLTPAKLGGLEPCAPRGAGAPAGDAVAAHAGSQSNYGPRAARDRGGRDRQPAYKVGLLLGLAPETLLAAQAWVFSTLATAFVWLRERRINYRYGAMAAAALLTGFCRCC